MTILKTELTKLLGIEYPVIQGGMAWVADGNLAATVSQAGGLGVIAASNMPPEQLRQEINTLRAKTNKPFGVNIMLRAAYCDAVAQLCIDENVPVITTGAGNPIKYIPAWKAAGIKVLPVVPSPNLALRMQRNGADAVIVEGCEAGGHIGEMTSMCLVPQARDAVTIPLVAAGGIADGRGFAAAIALGADGVQVGTAFICAEESPAHENYKQAVIGAKGTDTAVTGRASGHPVRSLKNPFIKKIVRLEKSGAPLAEIEDETLGSLRRAVLEGNRDSGSFMAGQSAGLVREILPAAVILERLVAGAVHQMQTITEERGINIG